MATITAPSASAEPSPSTSSPSGLRRYVTRAGLDRYGFADECDACGQVVMGTTRIIGRYSHFCRAISFGAFRGGNALALELRGWPFGEDTSRQPRRPEGVRMVLLPEWRWRVVRSEYQNSPLISGCDQQVSKQQQAVRQMLIWSGPAPQRLLRAVAGLLDPAKPQRKDSPASQRPRITAPDGSTLVAPLCLGLPDTTMEFLAKNALASNDITKEFDDAEMATLVQNHSTSEFGCIKLNSIAELLGWGSIRPPTVTGQPTAEVLQHRRFSEDANGLNLLRGNGGRGRVMRRAAMRLCMEDGATEAASAVLSVTYPKVTS